MQTNHSVLRRGFTLLEVLAVVAIISMLMALLLSGLTKIRNHADNSAALAATQQIVAAVKAYQTDYGRLPDVTNPGQSIGSSAGDAMVGDPAANITNKPNKLLFWTLRAIPEGPNLNDAQNPKKTVYFEHRGVQNTARPKNGFHDGRGGAEETRGCLFDPWGTQYNVVLDTNGDNVIDLSQQYQDLTGSYAPRVQIGAFSLGVDKQLGTYGDGMSATPKGRSDDQLSWR